MTKAKDDKPEDVEGPRSFLVFLRDIDDGTIADEASKYLHELTGKLSDLVAVYGGVAKGTLTLTVNLSALANGTVDVLADVKVKEPKPKRARSVFYLTKGRNLSPDNPRQQKLPLREVPPVAGKARDIADDRPAPRTL
jgi:hypothetical protein